MSTEDAAALMEPAPDSAPLRAALKEWSSGKTSRAPALLEDYRRTLASATGALSAAEPAFQDWAGRWEQVLLRGMETRALARHAPSGSVPTAGSDVVHSLKDDAWRTALVFLGLGLIQGDEGMVSLAEARAIFEAFDGAPSLPGTPKDVAPPISRTEPPPGDSSRVGDVWRRLAALDPASQVRVRDEALALARWPSDRPPSMKTARAVKTRFGAQAKKAASTRQTPPKKTRARGRRVSSRESAVGDSLVRLTGPMEFAAVAEARRALLAALPAPERILEQLEGDRRAHTVGPLDAGASAIVASSLRAWNAARSAGVVAEVPFGNDPTIPAILGHLVAIFTGRAVELKERLVLLHFLGREDGEESWSSAVDRLSAFNAVGDPGREAVVMLVPWDESQRDRLEAWRRGRGVVSVLPALGESAMEDLSVVENRLRSWAGPAPLALLVSLGDGVRPTAAARARVRWNPLKEALATPLFLPLEALGDLLETARLIARQA